MTSLISRAHVDSATRAVGAYEARPEELTELPPGTSPWFTVIIPTRNEAGSIEPLLHRLAAGLGDAIAEVLFVDDSQDETPDIIRSCARTSGLAVRLLHRGAF